MTYVVWVNHGMEGYARSEDMDTLDEVLRYITKETYGSEFEVTKTVKLQLIETPMATPGAVGWPSAAAGIRVGDGEPKAAGATRGAQEMIESQ